MDAAKVPQQDISTLSGNRKAVYATGEGGEYTVVASSGWSVEEAVTKQALEELERLTEDALQQVHSGKRSPLYFHMFHQRMDLATLAQSSGFFQWRVKRHFKPAIFSKLPPKTLAVYCDVLGLSLDELCSTPPAMEASSD